MTVRLLLVPYDTGLRDWRCGAGPRALLDAGLDDHLRGMGVDLAGIDVIEDDPEQPPAEIRSAFELVRRMAVAVRAARDAGELPLVLSGNCFAAVGVLSGLTPTERSVYWLDAHGDLNTPESTSSGFLDGMGLAVALGRCWRSLAASVPGFQPVSAEHTWLLGARALDPPEARMLEEAGVRLVRPSDVGGPLPDRPTADARERLGYVHVDLDVLDPDSVGRANTHAAQGGISVQQLADAIRGLRSQGPIGAATIASYAPECDDTGGIARAAFAALDALFSPMEDRVSSMSVRAV